MDSVKRGRDVVVQIVKNFKDIDVDLARLKKLVDAICNRFAKHEVPDTRYEINIAIVDDAEMCKANSKFLNCHCSTDCLSFDLSEDAAESLKSFELVVNAEMAVGQAKLRGHSSEAELALYITHSLLHNFGFDDTAREQAKKMHDTEDEILQQQGYGLVYNS